MATKSQIITSVNDYLTEIIDIADHRASMLELINQIYPTPIHDTQATTNVFTKAGLNMSYNFFVTKTGRNVTLSGSFKNITDFAITDQNICTITNSEFNNYVFPINQSFIAQATTGNIVRMILTSNSIFISGTIPTDTTFYFSFTYQVAN